MVDFDKIIEKYYTKGSDAYNLLTIHSRQVAELALQLADESAVAVDRDFVWEAAMLHDVGICRTNAPGIYCFGTEPYLRHGLIGKAMLLEEGLPRHALVCERHIGAGLTADEIREQGLPLPAVDMLPLTVEEKLVCYADKFYSKSHPQRERTVKQTAESLRKFGEAGVEKFLGWAQLFEGEAL